VGRPMETHPVAERESKRERGGKRRRGWEANLEIAAVESGKTSHQPDDGRQEFTMVPSVESLTRGSATGPPTFARRETAVSGASHSTMPTSGADFHTRYAATHTNQTSRKQSTPGPLNQARAGTAQTKVRQNVLGVDYEQSTFFLSTVTDCPQVRPALTSMVPHRTTHTGLQNLSTATAKLVALSSPTPSNRSAFSVQPSRVHHDIPVRSEFSATEFLTGREVSTDEAKRLTITTTTCGNVVSSHSKSVSRVEHRDTPSSTLSSTSSEVAYLTGIKEPNYVRPVPLLPLLRPRPPPVRGHIGRIVHLTRGPPKFRASHQRHNIL